MKRAILCLTLIGCAPGTDAPEQADGPDPQAERFVVSDANWTLDWDLGDALVSEDGGWTATTSEGYLVTVDAGWVVDYSVTLSPCHDEVLASRSTRDRLLGLLGVGTAYADHPDFTDPSQVEMVAAESLSAPGSVSVETTFEAATYCGLHWLVARGEAETTAPDGESAFGYSMKVSGTWAKNGEEGSFEISTDWANAEDWGWADVAVTLEDGAAPESWALDITVRRDLVGLFSGLDLATASEGEITWGLLDNLFSRTAVDVAFSPTTS